MKPPMYGAAAGHRLQRLRVRLEAMKSVVGQQPCAQLQKHHRERGPCEADLVRSAIESRRGRAVKAPSTPINDHLAQALVIDHMQLARSPIVAVPPRPGAGALETQRGVRPLRVRADQPLTDLEGGAARTNRGQLRRLSRPGAPRGGLQGTAPVPPRATGSRARDVGASGGISARASGGNQWDGTGETVVALLSARAAEAAADPAARGLLALIARDEARHAELAWRTLGWLLRAHGAPVRAALAAEVAALRERGVLSHPTDSARFDPTPFYR